MAEKEKMITPEELKALREKYKKGMRVECIRLDDAFTPIPAGTKGTVESVDDIGTVHVNWDCGSSLGAVYGTDEIKPATVRLHISMAYTFVGDTGIDIPLELVEGKTKEETLQAAYDYAKDHINEIPVADNAEYVADSDTFEPEDIDFGDEDGEGGAD